MPAGTKSPPVAWFFQAVPIAEPDHGTHASGGLCRSMSEIPQRFEGSDFEGVDLPPVILPSAGGRGRPPRWLVPLLLAVAGAGIALVAGSARSRDTPGVPSPGAESGAGVPGAGGSGLATALESVREAVDGYRQRHSDFERGRIDCAALTAGYGLVSQEVMELARRRRAAGDPDAETIASFESVMGDAAEIDRRFDESGCPRP